jgi:hypothetical protein
MILSFLYNQTFKLFVVIFWKLTEHIIIYILIILVYLKMMILFFGKKRRAMCRSGYNPHSARTSIRHVTCGTCEFLEICARAAESHAYTLCETAGSCTTLLLASPSDLTDKVPKADTSDEDACKNWVWCLLWKRQKDSRSAQCLAEDRR